MSEQLKILEMIESGKISATEGMELLDALKATSQTAMPETASLLASPMKSNYKFLKIKVSSDNKTVNVNVNIPIRLLTTIGEVASKVTTYIPQNAREQMEAKGIHVTSIDYSRIIEELLSGTLDDPSIVDVEAWDEEHKAMVYVKIYVE